MNVKEIARFIIEQGQNSYRFEDLEHELSVHDESMTYMYFYDETGPAIFGRYNILDDTADILDLVIRPDVRSPIYIKFLLAILKERYPFLENFTFQRPIKYPYRSKRSYNIDRMLRR
jgi:hypothetical protein